MGVIVYCQASQHTENWDVVRNRRLQLLVEESISKTQNVSFSPTQHSLFGPQTDDLSQFRCDVVLD